MGAKCVKKVVLVVEGAMRGGGVESRRGEQADWYRLVALIHPFLATYCA